MSGAPTDPVRALVAQLQEALADQHLSDVERLAFADALRTAQPPEDGLRRLRNLAFELARDRLAASADPQEVLRWLQAVVRTLDGARLPGGVHASRACFSPGEACLRTIVSHLAQSRRSADLCVFTLSDDRIAGEVLAAHRRRVAVRLLTDNSKEFDAGSDVAGLRAAGVPVVVDRTDAHMHHKFAIFDGTWLLNGSYNWTRSACYHNEENLVVSDEPALVRQFQGVFDRLWQELVS